VVEEHLVVQVDHFLGVDLEERQAEEVDHAGHLVADLVELRMEEGGLEDHLTVGEGRGKG
jgi:hypothetical protein